MRTIMFAIGILILGSLVAYSGCSKDSTPTSFDFAIGEANPQHVFDKSIFFDPPYDGRDSTIVVEYGSRNAVSLDELVLDLYMTTTTGIDLTVEINDPVLAAKIYNVAQTIAGFQYDADGIAYTVGEDVNRIILGDFGVNLVEFMGERSQSMTWGLIKYCQLHPNDPRCKKGNH